MYIEIFYFTLHFIFETRVGSQLFFIFLFWFLELKTKGYFSFLKMVTRIIIIQLYDHLCLKIQIMPYNMERNKLLKMNSNKNPNISWPALKREIWKLISYQNICSHKYTKYQYFKILVNLNLITIFIIVWLWSFCVQQLIKLSLFCCS